ncbi:elongation factor 1-alpha C-terminal domain-related protein, partial [Cobetia marina]
DWLVAADAELPLSNALEADVVWMHEKPLQPGRQYDIKLATRDLTGQVSAIDYLYDVNTLEHHEGDSLALNAIGRVQLELTQSVPVDDYRSSPGTGSFIVIDRLSNVTVGAGMIRGVGRSGTQATTQQTDWAAFEADLNALVRKHFPQWEARDVRELLGRGN